MLAGNLDGDPEIRDPGHVPKTEAHPVYSTGKTTCCHPGINTWLHSTRLKSRQSSR